MNHLLDFRGLVLVDGVTHHGNTGLLTRGIPPRSSLLKVKITEKLIYS